MMQCNQSNLFLGSIVNYQNSREDAPTLKVIGEFTTCAAKLYWIALVLTVDEDTAARIVSSAGMHGVAVRTEECALQTTLYAVLSHKCGDGSDVADLPIDSASPTKT
jgi:hypothetical protein